MRARDTSCDTKRRRPVLTEGTMSTFARLSSLVEVLVYVVHRLNWLFDLARATWGLGPCGAPEGRRPAGR